jgi:hypothetical protein
MPNQIQEVQILSAICFAIPVILITIALIALHRVIKAHSEDGSEDELPTFKGFDYYPYDGTGLWNIADHATDEAIRRLQSNKPTLYEISTEQAAYLLGKLIKFQVQTLNTLNKVLTDKTAVMALGIDFGEPDIYDPVVIAIHGYDQIKETDKYFEITDQDGNVTECPVYKINGIVRELQKSQDSARLTCTINTEGLYFPASALRYWGIVII